MSLSNLEDKREYDVTAKILEIDGKSGTGAKGAWYRVSLKIQAEDKTFAFLSLWEYTEEDYNTRKESYKVDSWYKFTGLKGKEFNGYVNLNFVKNSTVSVAKVDYYDEVVVEKQPNFNDTEYNDPNAAKIEADIEAFTKSVKENPPMSVRKKAEKKDLVEYTSEELLKLIKSLPEGMEKGVCRNLYQRRVIIEQNVAIIELLEALDREVLE